MDTSIDTSSINTALISYEVRPISDEYCGVYATYKNPDLGSKLITICNLRHNAELIRDILECDKNHTTCCISETNDYDHNNELDIANGNIVGYIDDLFHAKSLSIIDNSPESLEIVVSGFGRFEQMYANEMIAIEKMKATQEVIITRKFLGINLWSTSTND